MSIRPTRRTILIATGGAGAAALVAGCGDSGDDGGASDSTPTSTTSPGQDGQDGQDGEELAATDDIPVGGGTIFKDQEVVVTQPEQGEFKAFSAICTHQRCTVSTVADGTINCPCHGSRFNITDGSVANPPATKPLPEKQITVDGNSIRLV
ncbi:Rieske (2Fe-2S) protein [Streptomyces sp. AS02]|uniref:Rieske (2Fe-2S) protein n=1 Tax=Streptomyces sp. AS02 TaxID=2938946 RepID=UPI002021DE7F|nr:Rieske (2Fe-2S) protein [Streptomyces sp. AS02]MCL8012227.1 Rieske (2Fe-2S) protein [Streptomyces sp. AS02]